MRNRLVLAKKSHIIVVIVSLSIIVLIAGLFFLRYQAIKIRQQKQNDLQAIAALKISQLVQWRKDHTADVTVISQRVFFIKRIEQWLANQNDNNLKKDILTYLQNLQKAYAYEALILLSVNGDPLLKVGSELDQFDEATRQKLKEALARRENTYTDFYYCHCEHIYYDIIAPLFNENGRPIAMLIFRSDPNDFLYPLIQSWPTPSKTSETLIVRQEGDSVLFLNELRHRKDSALKFRIPLTNKDVPAVQAVLGFRGIWEGKDYRGKDVIADVGPVPGTPWFMISKIDKSEILKELYVFSAYTLVLTLFVIFSIIAAFSFIYSYRQRNIYRTLWQSQEEFKITLYSIGDAVITTDRHGSIKYLNHVAEQLTGWKESQAKRKKLEHVFKIFHENTREKVENPVERVLREGSVVGLANHTLLISKDGKEIPIADSGAPIRDEQGRVVGVVLVFRDQTEERVAQKKLRASEERIRRQRSAIAELAVADEFQTGDLSDGFRKITKIVLDTLKVERTGIWMLSDDQAELKCLSLCEAGSAKYSQGMILLTKNFSKYFEALRQESRIYTEDALNDPRTSELKDNYLALLGITSMLDAGVFINGKLVGVICSEHIGDKRKWHADEEAFLGTMASIIAQNLINAEREKMAEMLRESEEKYRLIVENANDGIEITQQDRLIFFNPQFAQMLGYTMEELKNVKFNHFFTKQSEQELYQRVEKRLLGEQLPPYYEATFIRKDGKVIDVGVKYEIIDYNGEPATFAIIRDITDRKKAELQIQQDLKVKTMLLTEIHHRVKNNLTVVASLLRLQSQKIKDRQSLEYFNDSINRIYAMAAVHEKIYSSKSFTNININTYIKDLIKNLFKSSELQSRIKLQHDVQDVVIGIDDAIPLAIIINELFTNSIKHAFPNNKTGAIEIKFNITDKKTYCLIFKDNGIGMPKNIDFNTTTSLGLHLVKMLAEQINGTAIIEQDGWTTFNITFKGYGYSKS